MQPCANEYRTSKCHQLVMMCSRILTKNICLVLLFITILTCLNPLASTKYGEHLQTEPSVPCGKI